MSALLRVLKLPPEITRVERAHVERVNRVGLWFFLAHPPVFMLVAALCGTGVFDALWMSLAILAGPVLARRIFDNPRHVSLVLGVTAMAMGGLLVHLGQGPMQIEMHFYFFVLLALLAVTGNPMAVVAAAATVSVHHLLFWALLPASVFNYDASIWVVLVHATFVVIESVAAIYVARSFFDNVIGLEKIVAARTEALDRRNADMRRVLDNVEQGLLTIDREGRVASERSAAVARLIGAVDEGERLASALERISPDFGAIFELGLDTLFEGIFPEELALAQMPERLEVDARVLRFDYRPIRAGLEQAPCAEGPEEDGPSGLLVVVSDITAEVERERGEETQRETLAVFARIVEDRAGFLQFFEESSRLVQQITSGAAEGAAGCAEILRALHTLKGNCGIFGVSAVARRCHAVEAAVLERGEGPSQAERDQLRAMWSEFSGRLGSMLGERADEVIELCPEDYDALMRAVIEQAPREQMEALVRSLKDEPVARRLIRLGAQAEQLARRLGKPGLEVSIEGAGLRLPGARWAPFWSAMVHAVRNAVDHGIETPSERRSAGKDGGGVLWLRFELDPQELRFELGDDGRGIDWAGVEARAHRIGLPTEDRAQLVEALFADGLSTRNEASEVSGRGVGMAALREATRALGGELRVVSNPGEGTRLVFSWPAAAVFGRGAAAMARVRRPEPASAA